jgi:hypothetical protein
VSQTDNKRKPSGGSGVVEDRYYTKEEYYALDPEQKKALSLKRAKRGHTPGTASSKVKGSKPNSAPVAVSKAVKKLVTRQVAELTKTKKETTTRLMPPTPRPTRLLLVIVTTRRWSVRPRNE